MNEHVVIVGAGIGGLVSALSLASRGMKVTVVDRAAAPGGKMSETLVDGRAIDAGPTVFTLRDIFDEIFAEAGARLDDHVSLTRAETLARHTWPDGGRLDLFADQGRSVDAIAAFAGPQAARGFVAFSAEAARIHATLEHAFLRAGKTGPIGLTARMGLAGLPALCGIRPYETLWSALGDHFGDPRLRQLFARYATYCGSSPFLAPATLMLIAHVEARGVWLIDGGMHMLAKALQRVAEAAGAKFRYGADCAEILIGTGGAEAVVLAGGERIEADAVIVNADPSALATGRFGHAARRAVAPVKPADRSLSALTWLLSADAEGFPLQRHNVFFSGDYAAEFADLARCRLPAAPTVYVCAQDRDDRGAAVGRERFQIIVNAPAIGERLTQGEIDQCEMRTFDFLRRCGLSLRVHGQARAGPSDFERRFPSTGGALYGRASHGWAASFRRPGARTRIPSLYLAGGATHPGSGVPMAALSGRLASEAVLADRASTRRFRPAAMPGGMSTRSATTAPMG